MKVKTVDSEEIWQSPDKAKTIWSVGLETADSVYRLKTYSEAIAKVGFEGEVESYVSKNGDRFVKQPQQEGGYKGGRGGGNNAERLQADAAKQREIRAEWAIGKAISSLSIFPLDDKALVQIQGLAEKLYTMVENVIDAAAENVASN